MEKTFWFDMDGTIADLYDVKNWLEKLLAEDETPYLEAAPMCNMSLLARYLNKARKLGFKIGIVSWLSKNSTTNYNEKVTAAKKKWLNTHLPSVSWDDIKIIPYGTPKFYLEIMIMTFYLMMKLETENYGAIQLMNQIVLSKY